MVDDTATQTETLAETLGTDLLADFIANGELALVVYHRDGSAVHPLRPEQALIIGRESPADLVLPERGMSRQHARLLVTRSGVSIEDLESTNGTLVNGVRVERAQLRLGDQVMLGGTLAALHALTAGAPKLRPIESHDRFTARVNEELVRSRTFRHAFALLMVQGKEHVGRWRGEVERLLRPVDHVGLYAADTLEILAPEIGSDELDKLALALSRGLRCGVAAYPNDGTTADALVATSRARVQGAAVAEPQPAAAAAGAKMRELYAQADRVARTSLPVLILGETGVGKEIVAQRLHSKSDREGKPLCAINCASIPDTLLESVLFGHEKGTFTGAGARRVGLLESANGGTVFLDEVGELPLGAQVALLRTLETKRIRRVGANEEIELDIRIVAATHRDLDKKKLDGTFREDLLYRLNTMTLRVPPLRERRDEIAPLTRLFIEGAAKTMRCEPPLLQPEAAALLEAHDWPGNVRELRNAVERAVAICQQGLITADELPEAVRRGGASAAVRAPAEAAAASYDESMRRFERELLLEALRACDANVTHAAKRLGMSRRTLTHRLKELGIQRLGHGSDP